MLTTPSRTIAATFAALALRRSAGARHRRTRAAARTRDLAGGRGPLALAPDPRSPDARVAARASRRGGCLGPAHPDARDAGAPAQPVVVPVDAPVTTGFDWTAAVIGAAGALAIAVIAGAGIALMRRRSPGPVV